MLIAEGLNKDFGTQNILRDIDFAIAPGAVNVVIGPSGSGKSTLIRSLALLDTPDKGMISIDGQEYRFPLRGQPILSPWPTLTVVFQQHFLWPHLTNYENIALPLRRRLDPSHVEGRIWELAEILGMEQFIKRFPNECSVGQQQRVALARALALESRYLLLDEVTASLDIEQISNLHELLLRLLENGIGIVLVTHLLSFADAMLRASADSTLTFMEAGKSAISGGRRLLTDPPAGRLAGFLTKMRFTS